MLIKLYPDAAADVQSSLTTYLATLPDGEAKSKGVELGQEVGAKILEARDNDGSSAPDAYRPKTSLVHMYRPLSLRLVTGDYDTFRLNEPLAISSEASALAEQRGMGQGLQ